MRFRNATIALCAASSVAAVAPSAAMADPPLASVQMKACRTGSDPGDRSGTFVGHIRSVPGSVRLAMHFRLVESSAEKGSARHSTDLGPWHTSREGVEKFTYTQTVNGMSPNESYRVVVRFRWFDASGNVIRRAKRTSAACTQPGLPNLTISRIAIVPDKTNGTAVYRVRVSNHGEGRADKVAVRLYSEGGHLIDSRKIKHLRGGATRIVKISGPACQPGHTVRAVVDPANRIEETNENDNTFTRTC